jgi:hypothetical protein
MKTLKPICQNCLAKVFTGFMLLVCACCEYSFQDITDYADPIRFFRMAVSLPSHIALHISDGLYECGCDEEVVSFDYHLAEIWVPILYLGASGGSVTTGDHTSSQTAGTDLTYYLVSIPGKDPASDYGHADLLFGYEADELV